MMTLIIILHVIICIVLIGLVLVQRGRGGGLVDSFQGVESMFGTKTNEFLTRTTTILSILFFITCLTLAVLSVQQSKSLMRNIQTQVPASQEANKQEPVKQTETKQEQEEPKGEIPQTEEK